MLILLHTNDISEPLAGGVGRPGDSSSSDDDDDEEEEVVDDHDDDDDDNDNDGDWKTEDRLALLDEGWMKPIGLQCFTCRIRRRW